LQQLSYDALELPFLQQLSYDDALEQQPLQQLSYDDALEQQPLQQQPSYDDALVQQPLQQLSYDALQPRGSPIRMVRSVTEPVQG
jgi:hypothetical protein